MSSHLQLPLQDHLSDSAHTILVHEKTFARKYKRVQDAIKKAESNVKKRKGKPDHEDVS